MPTKNFDEYPSLRKLLPRTGGLPGVRYLICPAQRVATMGQEDNPSGILWEMTTGSEPFTVQGVPCFLLSNGKPNLMGDSTSCIPELFTMRELDTELGLN